MVATPAMIARRMPSLGRVTDAFGAEIERAPDRLRPGVLAGMGGEMESIFGGIGIGIAKQLGRTLLLVAPHADGDDVPFPEARRNFEHLAGGHRAELAHGIEDP